MRRSFVIGLNGQPQSALVEDDAAPAIQIGMLFVFAADVPIEPYGVIKKGCKCWVSYVDAITGHVELTAEGDEPALYWWNCRIQLMPYDTDDILKALRRRSEKLLQKKALVAPVDHTGTSQPLAS